MIDLDGVIREWPKHVGDPDQMGNPPFSAWHSAHPGVGLATDH